MNASEDGKFPKGYEWVLAIINGVGSLVSSKIHLPLKPLAGFETPSLLIAFIIGLLGACFGFYRFRGDKIVVLLLALGFVAAILFYHSLLSFAGLTLIEKSFAVFLYAYLFFSAMYVIAFCERGLSFLNNVIKPKD